jgi:cell division protein FtsI/penicillin-binding protein 2
METVFTRRAGTSERIVPAEVAAVVRQELFGVVEYGTARAAFDSVKLTGGVILPLGGKTGTGDNRLETYGVGREVLQSKAMSRTAAFVFVIGNRFYGTVIAYVPGQHAEAHSFTSSLAVRIFKHLVPTLRPVLERAAPDPQRLTRRFAQTAAPSLSR